MSDKIIFAKGSEESAKPQGSWKLLIVDDEPEIHDVTLLALHGFTFAGKDLQFVSAFNGEEAKQIVREQPDIALILLDVMMETPRAGLDVANYIRNDLANKTVRIVLRTGQPGDSPSYEIITRFDINDYKEKTELTRDRLFTTVYASLSAYRELQARESYLRGLIKIIDASARMFDLNAIHDFASGVLEQLTSLLYMEQDALLIEASAMTIKKADSRFYVVASSGRFKEFLGRTTLEYVNTVTQSRIDETLAMKANNYGSDFFAGYYKTADDHEYVLYASANASQTAGSTTLMEIFVRNVAIAHQNIKNLPNIQNNLSDDE